MTSQLGVWSLGGMWFGDGCRKILRNALLRSPHQGVEVQKGAQGSGFRVGICLGSADLDSDHISRLHVRHLSCSIAVLP